MAINNRLNISQITDRKKMEACAELMSVSDPWITYQMEYRQCLKAFEGPCKEIYIMEDENTVAGFAILQVCGTFKGYIQTICISESYRGKGLGRKLVGFCEERILKISPNIFICVSSFNKRAAKLYDELGYKMIGELKDFLKTGFTELLLRKTVGPTIDYPVTSTN